MKCVMGVFCLLFVLCGAVDAAAPMSLPMRLHETGRFSVGIDSPRALAIDGSDRLYVATASGVDILDLTGKRLGMVRTERAVTAVVVDADGVLYAALKTRIAKFGADGAALGAWGREGAGDGEFGYITALALRGAILYVADAGNRRLDRFAVNGDFVDDVRGYQVPSPYFDCAVAGDDTLCVVDPGNHQLVFLDGNMKRVRSWGGFGAAPEQFVGCCNPTNIIVWPDGRVATAEKGEPRLKVYDRDGGLLAFLGPEAFSPVTAGMDLALDAKGRLLVLEPAGGEVRIYEVQSAEKGIGERTKP